MTRGEPGGSIRLLKDLGRGISNSDVCSFTQGIGLGLGFPQFLLSAIQLLHMLVNKYIMKSQLNAAEEKEVAFVTHLGLDF